MQCEWFPASGLADLEKKLSGLPFRGESLAAATTGFLNPYRAFRGKHTLSKVIVEGGTSLLLLVLGPIITILNRGPRIRLNYKASQPGSERGGPDDSFSLEPTELAALCRDVKTAWEALGTGQLRAQVQRK